MNPLISIIVPIFNAEKHLKETISSVLHQTWKNWEMIMIDDGSTDNSFKEASSFSSSKIKVCRQENAGASNARNHGLRLAQGNYIQFLDADDLLSANKIAQQINLLQNNEPDSIASCAWGRFITDPQTAVFRADGLWKDLNPVDFLVYKYNYHSMMQPGVWLIPRDIVDKSGLWDETLVGDDDGEYFSRVILASRKICFCEDVKVYYRTGNMNSLSRRKDSKAVQALIKSVELCGSQLLSYEDTIRTREAVANMFQKLVFTLYPFLPEERNTLQKKIAELGGSSIRYKSTPLQDFVTRFAGWKIAKRVHQIKDYFFSP